MEKRNAAKILFFEGIAQKEIAKLLGTTETTIGSWKQKDGWEEEKTRKFLLESTNTEYVQKLINYQLKTLNNKVQEWEQTASGTLIQKGEIDALSKLYATIKKKDTEWTEYVQIMREFITWLSEENSDLAKKIVDSVDLFLNQKRADL